ncbi:hypothetical protein Nepgr_019580 [Nepenthes gracilis]|uniref:Uncharacterized protein n=1 Tax=Nepenthes gracilis TaxID=150966 RepID=A0AAD3SVI1_NEPGR|nr:hypothetical protein Nepgr_019580 [Nepenthes gracilis]
MITERRSQDQRKAQHGNLACTPFLEWIQSNPILSASSLIKTGGWEESSPRGTRNAACRQRSGLVHLILALKPHVQHRYRPSALWIAGGKSKALRLLLIINHNRSSLGQIIHIRINSDY